MVDPEKPNFGGTPVAPWRRRAGYAPADPCARPALSIVTAFHAPGPLFEETVGSVLAQTLQQWEWLVVDDASPGEEAQAQLAALRERDPRIRVHRLPQNRGRSAARNHGIAAARSERIFVLDHDDLLEPTALEKCLWFLATHPAHGFVNGWSVSFGAQQLLWDRGFERGEAFLERNQVSGRALIRRSVLERLGGYDESLREGFEDWDLWLRAAAEGIWGATIPEYLDWFRRRDPPADWERPGAAEAFRERLRARLPDLYAGAFPGMPVFDAFTAHVPAAEPPFANRLVRREKRLLVFVSRLSAQGGGALLLQAVDQLVRQGWGITLVALEAEADAAVFGRTSADVFVTTHFLPAGETPRFLRYLLASRGHDRILIEHGPLASVLSDVLRSAAPDVRQIALCHRDPDDAVQRGQTADVAKLAQHVDRVLVTSDALQTAVLAAGAEAARVGRLALGVDTTVWQPAEPPRGWLRERWGAGADETVVLFWGRLDDAHQVEVLAGALRALVARGAPCRAVLIGRGPRRAWLEAFIDRHGLGERVRFHEPDPQASVLKALAAADVFVLPARSGTALSCIHALASGLPVVATLVEGQGEILDETCGVLIEPGDVRETVRAFADALEALALDGERRGRMSRAARTRALARFGADRVAATISTALSEVGREPPRAARGPSPETALARAVQRFRMVVYGETMRSARERAEQLAREQAAELRALRRWNEEQSESRRWLEDERRSWERIAGEHAERAESQQAWIARVEEAVEWNRDQREHWMELAVAHEGRLDELEAARRWHDAERQRIAEQSEQRRRRIEELEEELARNGSGGVRGAPDEEAG